VSAILSSVPPLRQSKNEPSWQGPSSGGWRWQDRVSTARPEQARLRSLIDSLRRPRSTGRSTLQTFAELLRSHIQREERELFVTFQDAMPPERATELAGPIKQALAADPGRGPSCSAS
jgi:hypothetical protein